jgi:hypothetical protein
MEELWSKSPRWLEYSGLPEYLRELIGTCGWTLFKKIIELDCFQNYNPDTVKVTIKELCRVSGVPTEEAHELLEKLVELEYIKAFLPDSDEEEAWINIVIPINTPRKPDEIRKEHGGLLGLDDKTAELRYTVKVEKEDSPDEIFNEVQHLYFTTCGSRMNQFVLEDLQEMAREFSIEEIRAEFGRAKKRKNKALKGIIRKLYERRMKDMPLPDDE